MRALGFFHLKLVNEVVLAIQLSRLEHGSSGISGDGLHGQVKVIIVGLVSHGHLRNLGRGFTSILTGSHLSHGDRTVKSSFLSLVFVDEVVGFDLLGRLVWVVWHDATGQIAI